ncbi:MAG: hypothetical protein H0W02_09430 [Ktedonobacteraceae bacterium]|nr:hypothetical protein [Ktedonobacteraceae bacterium]
MTRLKLAPGAAKRVTALSAWLFALFLRAYPASFRRAYGSRMVSVFRDSCRDALQRRGLAGLTLLWWSALFDLLFSACLERWQILKEEARSMALNGRIQNFPPRLWIALAATVVAFAVSLVASLNLYLLEDANPLTQAAYSASSLLRFSYVAIYVSALAAGVAVCSILVYALVQRQAFAIVSLSVVALVVVVGGFGGLLVRQPVTFLVCLAIFLALMLIGFLSGRAVASHAGRFFGQRPAAVLGACAGAGSLLLVNVVALVLHTILLNPISHALYMQGQIEGTHLNFTLIVMGLAFLTMLACVLSLGIALRLPARQL